LNKKNFVPEIWEGTPEKTTNEYYGFGIIHTFVPHFPARDQTPPWQNPPPVLDPSITVPLFLMCLMTVE